MGNTCTTCGTENATEAKYCIKCGLGLSTEIEQSKKPEEPKRGGVKKVLVIVASLVIILLLMTLPTTVTVQYQRTEDYSELYPDKEPYDVQVAYDTTESYPEKEPYIVYYMEQEPFQDIRDIQTNIIYNVAKTVCAQRVPLISDAKVTYNVQNLDTVGGYFNLWAGFYLPDGNKIGQEISKYIYPSQSADFTYTANTQVSSCSYNIVSIPTKTIRESFTNYRNVQKSRTEFRDVQKTKTVIKYRTDKQYRDVMKQRPAQRQVIDYRQQTVMMYQKILGWY